MAASSISRLALQRGLRLRRDDRQRLAGGVHRPLHVMRQRVGELAQLFVHGLERIGPAFGDHLLLFLGRHVAMRAQHAGRPPRRVAQGDAAATDPDRRAVGVAIAHELIERRVGIGEMRGEIAVEERPVFRIE
jgi:hypothetical protein